MLEGTLKYHDSRPGGLPGCMVGPLVEGGDPWVWTPEWGQSMTTAGIVGPVTLERTGDASLDALFVTPLGEHTVQVAVVATNHLGDDAATLRRWVYGIEEAPADFICRNCVFAR